VRKRVLFFRDFRAFQGGHLKIWHYYQHLKHSAGFEPRIYFTGESVWNADNPWLGERDEVEPQWEPAKADILFVGGMDWSMIGIEEHIDRRIPVVNLIQHVRHADPADPRFYFLSRKAVRICVSEEVSEALRQTKRVNGPIVTITNGLDLDEMPVSKLQTERDIETFILGLKNPRLARELVDALRRRGIPAEVQSGKVPRALFLDKLSRSQTVVLLPSPTEGFYLPALEGMALGAVVICPDCVGNRSFCAHGSNCLMPEYSQGGILDAVVGAWSMASEQRENLIANARRTAEQHSLIPERRKFLEIMNNIDRIW
jgi:Glycosyl transferases group 1